MSFYVASSYWEGSFRIISFYVYPFLCDILSIADVTSSSKGEWLTVFIYFLGSSCHLLYLRECFFCFTLLCELPVNMFNCSSQSMKLNFPVAVTVGPFRLVQFMVANRNGPNKMCAYKKVDTTEGYKVQSSYSGDDKPLSIQIKCINWISDLSLLLFGSVIAFIFFKLFRVVFWVF